MKWYWIVLIVIVIVWILYKLAKKHNSTVQYVKNADGTSTSYVTTPTQQLIISHDINGNTSAMKVHANPVFVVVNGK